MRFGLMNDKNDSCISIYTNEECFDVYGDGFFVVSDHFNLHQEAWFNKRYKCKKFGDGDIVTFIVSAKKIEL